MKLQFNFLNITNILRKGKPYSLPTRKMAVHDIFVNRALFCRLKVSSQIPSQLRQPTSICHKVELHAQGQGHHL